MTIREAIFSLLIMLAMGAILGIGILVGMNKVRIIKPVELIEVEVRVDAVNNAQLTVLNNRLNSVLYNIDKARKEREMLATLSEADRARYLELVKSMELLENEIKKW